MKNMHKLCGNRIQQKKNEFKMIRIESCNRFIQFSRTNLEKVPCDNTIIRTTKLFINYTQSILSLKNLFYNFFCLFPSNSSNLKQIKSNQKNFFFVNFLSPTDDANPKDIWQPRSIALNVALDGNNDTINKQSPRSPIN